MAYMAQEGAYDKEKACEFPNSEKYGKKASKSINNNQKQEKQHKAESQKFPSICIEEGIVKEERSQKDLGKLEEDNFIQIGWTHEGQ